MFGGIYFGAYPFASFPVKKSSPVPAPAPVAPVCKRSSLPVPSDWYGQKCWLSVPTDWFAKGDSQVTWVSAWSDFREQYPARVSQDGSLVILAPRTTENPWATAPSYTPIGAF